MRYNIDEPLFRQADAFTMHSNREILQYALGGILYCPGTNRDIWDKIHNHELQGAGAICLCLEDAVGDDMVEYGERVIIEGFQRTAGLIDEGELDPDDLPLMFIRVRTGPQMPKLVGMGGNSLSLLSGFNVPKFDMATQRDFVEGFQEASQRARQRFYLLPIIESKAMMFKQMRVPEMMAIREVLKTLGDSVLSVFIGGADFCNLYGIRRGIHDTIYDITILADVISDCMNIFGRDWTIPGPVWEYFGGTATEYFGSTPIEGREWYRGLLREFERDKLQGCTGKICVHPSQSLAISRNMAVSRMDYADAQGILGMNQNTTGVAKSPSGTRMNEVKAHQTWARRVMTLAGLYGVM